MKIEHSGSFSLFASDMKTKQEKNETNMREEENKKVSADVGKDSIKKETEELSSMIKSFRYETVVREDKVRLIRERLENGTYDKGGMDVVKKMMGR